MVSNKILTRSRQDPSACWAITDIFPSDQAWSRALDDCRDFPKEIAAFQGTLGSSAANLLAYLQRSEAINRQVEQLYVYAFLRADEDTADSAHQAMKGRCFSFLVQLNSASAFEGPELVAIDEDTLTRFYQEEPKLERYRRYLTRARLEKDHILSPAEEALLAGAAEVGNAPGNIYNTLLDADMTFPDVTGQDGQSHTLTSGTFIPLMERSDRTLRSNTFSAYYRVYRGLENTLAASYNGEVRKNLFFSTAQKYASVLESALAPNEVPVSVYDNLIAAVRGNLDKLHHYMSLRKRVMGLDELHMYDLYAPMLPDAQESVSFQQAKADVLAATAVLGEDYSKVLAQGLENRWIDLYENKGKRSGAYSCGCPGVHPFVLLNQKDTLNDAFTLAHEMGHAMHSYLSEKHQPYIDSDYVLFVAEVASTCNEALLMQYLLGKTDDPKRRAVLINYFLEQFRTTVYRQTMFAEFELEAHRLAEQGETLTAQTLNDLYLRLNRDYYGENMVVDPEIAIEWARIPHFYRHFYVYQYATGFSAAMALSARILREGEPAVRDYLRFLSGGCSTDPVSLLKIAGVDMSTPEPVNAALNLFGSLIDELDELL